MPSVNTVIIAGNLTREPELRYTQNGTAVCQLGVAINSAWTDDSGQKKESVTFVDVTAWGRTAENGAQYLRKGSPLLVEGRLELDHWEDKQTGEKRSRLNVVAERVQFLSAAPAKPTRAQ